MGCDGAAWPGEKEPGTGYLCSLPPSPHPVPSPSASEEMTALPSGVSESLLWKHALCPVSLLRSRALLGRDHIAFLRLNSKRPWPPSDWGPPPLMAVCLSPPLSLPPPPHNRGGLLHSDCCFVPLIMGIPKETGYASPEQRPPGT